MNESNIYEYLFLIGNIICLLSIIGFVLYVPTKLFIIILSLLQGLLLIAQLKTVELYELVDRQQSLIKSQSTMIDDYQQAIIDRMIKAKR